MSQPMTVDDTRRAAATWVAGTGAFLLLAAATVFTAVRWDELPPLGKLAILWGVTAAFLAGGTRLRRTLPGTGAAVLHLGVLLAPLDAVAVALHLHLGWAGLLLVGGGAGVAAFPLVERALDSVVLRWAGTTAVVVTVTGLAGASPVPAGPLLAALGAVALVTGSRRPAVTWAAVAGLSPLLVLVPAAVLGGGVMRDLGLAGDQAELFAAVSGALAAWTFASEARRLDDPAHAWAAVTSAIVGVATTWIARVPADAGTSAGVGFLVVELLALALRRDRLWRPITAAVADLAEGLAIVVATVTAVWWVVLPQGGDAVALVQFGLLALAWVAADLRRQLGRPGVGLGLLLGGGWPVALPLFGLSAVAAAAATGSAELTAAVLLAVTALAVVSARPGGLAAGGVAAVLVPLHLGGHPVLAAAAGLAAAGLLAEDVVLRTRATAPRAWLPLLPALGTVVVTAAVVGWTVPGLLVGAVFFATGTWLVAVVVDRADVRFGHAVRLAGLAGVALVPPTPQRAAVLGGLVLVLVVVDSLRLREPRLVLAAALALPYGLVGLLVDHGASRASAGVGVTLAGVVVAGLAAVVDDELWRGQLALVALAIEGIGVVLAGEQGRTLGDALLVAGAVVLGGGLALRRREVAHLGAVSLTIGIWVHLALSGVVALDAYAAPVAVQLLVAGVVLRRRGSTSSWVAYGPAVALGGGLPLAERLAGGGAGHALVAGAVGVVALVLGGHRRLAAPLLVGTGLCVVLTGYESLAVTAGVPTWGWLALAGSVLLASGVTIERTGVSPVASGRRLADVVRSEFG